MLYYWCDTYPEYYDVANHKHWKQAPDELRKNVIKHCFINGESVKLVAEEIGYTSSLIYKSNVNVNVNPTDITSAEDIESLKAQMFEMQMGIDALRDKYSLPAFCKKLTLLEATIIIRNLPFMQRSNILNFANGLNNCFKAKVQTEA